MTVGCERRNFPARLFSVEQSLLMATGQSLTEEVLFLAKGIVSYNNNYYYDNY